MPLLSLSWLCTQLSWLLLCLMSLLSQSSDNLSCPNGLPKHPLQYHLFLLALTSTSSFFGYILFIILPGIVITLQWHSSSPQRSVAATMGEKPCEVQEAAHPDSSLMITTPSLGLWKCHPNTLALLCTSDVRIQCSATKRPGARHRQMALLLVIWWQIYTAGARPLLMLLLDRVGLKAIPTITSTLQSVKNSVYWAPRQHRCPVNPSGLQTKRGHGAFPKKVHHHTHVFQHLQEINTDFVNSFLII